MANSPIHTFVVLAYRESPYLEQCIKSVVNQNYPSQVVIATTTPNSHIDHLAAKYHLEIITGPHTNIGGDFDFAIHAATTPLVTVAHQDDLYNKSYSAEVVKAYHSHPTSSIIFTDYYELRGDRKVFTNTNLKIKRILLTPIRIKPSLDFKFMKRNLLRFGNSICCPAVTFVRRNCPVKIFSSNLKCNVDWHAWETLSRHSHSFTFVAKPLMGHRISEFSTTTDIINQGIRTKEDYQLFQRFWPTPLAKLLTRLYQSSERSNQLHK